MKRNRINGAFVLIVSMLASIILPLAAQGQSDGADGHGSIRGFSAAQAGKEVGWEQKMRAIPKPDFLREYMKHLSAEPHNVGTAYDKQNAEYILAKFKSWGLNAHIEEFEVLYPTPLERQVELVAPERYEAKLKEPAVPEDPYSGQAGQLPTYHVYAADGDVTGDLVYVNYGVPADYEELTKQGIDVKGKIVIARYGGSWRGIKPKVAHEHGAIGCLIYSDPRDDGYFRGDVYPKGPYRPEWGVQRGSVMDMPIHPGDPLTPGWGAVKGAKRITKEESDVLMKIPVLPIAWGDALPLLKNLGGPVAPEAWRGALPITYHLGGGPARVHIKLKSDWSLKTIYDVIARIDGSEFPDEWIIQGNHHDAWVNGADDPISGQVTMMEEARALGELGKQGWRPRRTIIICAWDAEEPALIGSTEWVETHADELKDKAVAYLNSDSTGKGWLGTEGSHSLERFMNEVARDIPDPKDSGSVWSSLKKRRTEQARTDAARAELGARQDLRIGAMGSGSDYTPFIQHMGIASLNTGFQGEGGGGVYHSIYDTFTWYTRFSDGTFEYGRALSELNGTIMMRLADAQVLPFEFTDLSDTINMYIGELQTLEKTAKPPAAVDFGPLTSASARLKESANHYEEALRKASASGGAGLDAIKQAQKLNELLFRSERRLLTEEGLPRRPWFKHSLYAPGFYTGYGVKTIPGVREALEEKQWSDIPAQMSHASAAINSLADQIDQATRILEGM